MPALREYKVFISHVWHRSEHYQRVVDWLNEAPNFVWTNLSVPEHNPIHDTNQLEYELRGQMRPADVFLILGGMYATRSEWIDFELSFARRIGRPIIGIKPWGAQVMPIAVTNVASVIVGWNGGSIVQAIRTHALTSVR
jgi:hypothetical protein